MKVEHLTRMERAFLWSYDHRVQIAIVVDLLLMGCLIGLVMS